MSRHTIAKAGTGLLLAGLLFTLPSPVDAQGCTATQGYWKNHPAAWGPVGYLNIGQTAYLKEDLIQLLWTAPRGDATYILAQQLIAAMLNVMSGALSGGDSGGIGLTIAEAGALLERVGLGTWPTGADREALLAFASQLDAFNNGSTGVPHCEDGPVVSPGGPPPVQ